ncbi:MAG TPA: lysophospholipid acyltransferase family protein [Opitutaceae bacterium]|nr:lysophospholipid acyltransferase family protein [Opitutaceae bacterium]
MSAAFPQVEMTPTYGVSHYWLRVMFDMFFRGQVAGTENLPTSGAFLIAANHASHLDPPLIGSHVSRQMCFFARKTLWIGGAMSWWLDAVGTIPVDRDGGQDVSALKRVLRALADGKVMILFPEGTRSLDGTLQSPKPGVGFIVCKTQVPVVPARIFGSFEAFGKGAKFPTLGSPVNVVFGRPIPPAVYDDPAAGKERYQVASARIMAEIAKLQPPVERVV